MTSTSFTYPESLIDECAASNVALSLGQAAQVKSFSDRPRPLSKETAVSSSHSVVFPSANGGRQSLENDRGCDELWRLYKNHFEECNDDTEWGRYRQAGHHFYRISQRAERFLRSVLFIHQHNHAPGSTHTVSLNRFSAGDTAAMFAPIQNELSHHYYSGSSQPESEDSRHRRRAATRQAQVSSAKHIIVKEIRVPDLVRKPFQTPFVSSDKNGYILTVKKRHLPKKAYYDEKSDPGVVQLDAVPSEDRYKDYLNWATTDNPDGVPIVRESFDQLSCGSCWAFAAAGSLEASASRRAAFIAYEAFHSMHRKDIAEGNQSLEDEAISLAQRVQQRSMHVLNLSVQQLLDCDSADDQGCVGGNPLLAFDYIHQNGLVSWTTYPYRAEEGACQLNATKTPIATVKSWGIIKSDHEKHMELALRYIGPIAVGIYGNTPEFLAYKSGIFDSPNCKQTANHALLIVGYGQEWDSTGIVKQYWIARNSWGKGWGENGGYVRIKRGSGHSGVPGVCGVARNPSVALGGVLLRDLSYVFNETSLDSLGFPADGFCFHFLLPENPACFAFTAWVINHKASIFGLVGIFCGLLLIWPLTQDIRRRYRYRQRQRLEIARKQQSQSLSQESTPLIT